MGLILELGGVVMEFCSDRKLPLSPVLACFQKDYQSEPEVKIDLTWDWENSRHPVTEFVGEDLLQEYYREGEFCFCESKGGKAPVTCTCYNRDFTWIQCAINEKPFLEPPDTVDKILRLLPMRAVFLHFHTLFLHASQVSAGGVGIVFSAPSGTGKTTQARLWQKYVGAELICNDRTLIRKKDENWNTYGYPIDGSEPVCSSAVNRLGCIVLLKQGTENQVKRLRTGQAVSMLMEQTVMDCWDIQAREDVMHLLLEIVQEIPVYQQICTPDNRAAELLKKTLIQEGVITNGSDCKTFMG